MDRLLQKQKYAPSQAGKEQAQKFREDKEKRVKHIEQCKAEQNSKVGKGNDAICSVLGACFSHAPKISKDTRVSRQIWDVEYTVLKSEKEVLKSSLAFERETGEKLRIQIDQLVIQNNRLKTEVDHLKTKVGHLKTEVDHLRTLLAAAERREKQLLEKEAPVSDRWLHKLVHCMDLETCDGDIWCAGNDVEIVGTSDPDSCLVSLRPLVKTKTGADSEICTPARTNLWLPEELVQLREKYSRREEESEVEYVWRVSLTGGDRILLNEEEA